MKKTMMAVAALSATVAMAADIVSSDIVGYTVKDLSYNTSTFCPTFADVQTGDLDIQGVIPSRKGAEASVGDGDIYFQEMDEDGVGTAVYYYIEGGEQGPGWYWEEDLEQKSDKVFDFGEGIVLTCNFDDAQFTMSGKVDTETTSLPLPYNTSVFGNTRPTTLSLQDIVPSRTGEEASVGDGDIYFQEMDEDGVGTTVYYYIESGEQGPGWYWEEDLEHKTDKVLGIGESIVMTCNFDDAIFTLPEIGK